MILEELVRELQGVMEIHPESKDAQIWIDDHYDEKMFRLMFFRYDKRHHPYRIIFE